MGTAETVNWEHVLVDHSDPLKSIKGPSMADFGVLLVGHGTRRQSGQSQFRDVFRQFERHLAPVPAAQAFLELAEPDIPTAVRQLADQGITKLITVPVLLFAAGHAQRDIPQAVSAACRQHGLDSIEQTTALRSAEPVIELSATRFRQAVCQAADANQAVRCTHGCLGAHCPHVGLAMIGRGSRSSTATDEMRQFTSHRCQLTPVSWVTTGFIHAQRPNVTEALDALETTSCQTAVVQPHLLFEGELMDELRQQVAERQRKNPAQRWVVTNTLGVDELLSATLAEFARKTLEKCRAKSPKRNISAP